MKCAVLPSVRRSWPKAKGLPGLMAKAHKCSSPKACTAGFTWSSSPTDTPPLVRIRSCCWAACANMAWVGASLSGRLPKSVTTQPRRSSKARRKKRLELKMAPGGNWWGARSPGMTNSSPVDNRPTRGRTCTGNCAMPMLAASPSEAGVKRKPLGSTTWPCAMSSPCLRMHWPALGGVWICTRPSSKATQSSCITTASAPCGTGAPVKMRAA